MQHMLQRKKNTNAPLGSMIMAAKHPRSRSSFLFSKNRLESLKERLTDILSLLAVSIFKPNMEK